MSPRPPLSERISKRTVNIVAGCGVGVLALAMLAGSMTTPNAPASTATTPVPAAKRPAAIAPVAAPKMDKGQYCLSPFSGEDPAFVDAVKAHLRDPASFEHIATRVDPADKSGLHPIMMQFRSRNGFGGMNVEIATGQLNDVTCDATVDHISE